MWADAVEAVAAMRPATTRAGRLRRSERESRDVIGVPNVVGFCPVSRDTGTSIDKTSCEKVP